MSKAKKLTVVEVLSTIDDGGALEDVREAIEEVTAAVTAAGQGAKGQVTLVLAIDRASATEVRVTDSVAIKVPKITKDPSTFFVHPHGGLTRENPAQGRLAIDQETGEVVGGN